MKAQTTLAIPSLLVIFSCKQNQEQRPLSFSPKVVEAHGHLVPKNGMAVPKVVPAHFVAASGLMLAQNHKRKKCP